MARLRNGEFALPPFKPLIPPAPFKGSHGGRGSAKSYFFADLHLFSALEQFDAYRALCLRQVQKSIRESLKRLLEERIQFWGVGDKFRVYENKIETPGGGEFVFHGLQDHTAESIKSFEGFDVADIEEAHTVKQRALDLLIPTIIRKEGAEIRARWNPRHETDAIDLLFRGGNPPPRSVCVEVGYKDNPYLNEVTLDQIAADYVDNPEKAAHIWGGGYEVITEGAYFAKMLHAAEADGRVGKFPYDPDRKVITAWDIGVDDYTAIWFFQEDGKSVRVIDYYETSGDGADVICSEAIHSKPYSYEKHYLPHDVKVREWGGGAKERRLVLMELGISPLIVGVARNPDERIAAVRSILPICHFDDNEQVKFGIKRLRNYKRKWNESLQTYQGPLKDGNDHGADAFGEFAVNCMIRAAQPEKPKPPRDKYARDDDEDEDSWLIA